MLFYVEGKTAAAAAITMLRGKVLSISSFYEMADCKNTPRGWVSGLLAVPAAGWCFSLSIRFPGVSLLYFLFQC